MSHLRRFGGPGIKKKACIARVCRSLSSDKDDTWIDEGERSEPERIEAESEEVSTPSPLQHILLLTHTHEQTLTLSHAHPRIHVSPRARIHELLC